MSIRSLEQLSYVAADLQPLAPLGNDAQKASHSSADKVGGIDGHPHTAPRSQDWSRQVTLEERKFVREKIRAAYMKRISSLEDLLDTCSAIEEELIFASAPSRLDYFKIGVQYEKRVSEKRSQLKNGISDPKLAKSADIEVSEDSNQPKQIKRAKTNH